MADTHRPPIRVGVCGAAGKMGRAVVKAVLGAPDLELVMALDVSQAGQDAALMAGEARPCGVQLEFNLTQAMQSKKPHVVVDFTNPLAVLDNAITVMQQGGHSVIGTTGLSSDALKKLEATAVENRTSALVAPNFALGGVLMMKFAQEASKYFSHAEIIEYHHNQKHDAPSGTAMRTAQLMEAVQPEFAKTNTQQEKELLTGARGAATAGKIQIHSVRLPGLVAHQEVIFGDQGQTLTIRHDSLDRTSFMPGVLLAVRKVMSLHGLVVGLENVM